MAGILKSVDLERAGLLETMTKSTTPSKKVNSNVKKGLMESRQSCPLSSKVKITPCKKNGTPSSTNKNNYESKHCKPYDLCINDENSANNNTPVGNLTKLHPTFKKADGAKPKKVKNSSRYKLKRKRHEVIKDLLDSPDSTLNVNYDSSDDENEEKPMLTTTKKKVVYNISRENVVVKSSTNKGETTSARTKEKAKSGVPTLETFERQTGRSPKRMKVSYDQIFDSRYGMCMLQ
jgi:hypothetical protein